jgi:uncharacterized protein with PQ loop repeat
VLVVLGAVASFFSLSSSVPQVRRALRSRCVEGLSSGSVLLTMSAMVMWSVYAAVVMDRVQLVNNVIAFGLAALLVFALVRARGGNGGRDLIAALLAVVAAGVVAVSVAQLCGPFVLAMVGTLLSSVRLWPQTRLALAGAPLWGLDPWATVLGQIGWFLWAVYGMSAGDHALALCSVTGLVMQTTITAYRLPPRRTLHAVAGGRLGPVAARLTHGFAGRFPLRVDDFELAA